MEIRLHGRGGQGGVTCAKILAAVYARLGLNVQTFGDYASERSGAPVRAYTRVSEDPITNRNKVYHPDHLLVLDPTLLGKEVVAGLVAGGLLLVNSTDSPEALQQRFPGFRLAVVDATGIARKHKIGTRSVVIVNTTIAGAFVRAMGISLEVLERAYQELGFFSNFPAAKEAYDLVAISEPEGEPIPDGAGPAGGVPVEALTDHQISQPSNLQTGSWRTQMPEYVDHLAPCNAWCPAGNDVIGFVQAAIRKSVQDASHVLGRSTPLAATCGRVCPAPCMEGCNRAEYDGAVNIRGLERWIADQKPVAQSERAELEQPKRFAVLGGGPAGLAAAYELAREGHRVVIFEGEKKLGGVLRTGIPEYRLPRPVLDQEVQGILDLGVEVQSGKFLAAEDMPNLLREFDGLIVATGLQKLRSLSIPGNDLDGVQQGIHFLHRLNLEGGIRLRGHVVVLGGGNTAMDCARSALRCGAEKVTVAYRRTEKEMPAIREEIEEAHHEGIHFLYQRQPVALHGDGRVKSLVLAEVEMGEPDDSGRRRPIVTERTEAIACDAVLLALGQSADFDLLPEAWKLQEGRLYAGEKALPAFGAGDLATGDGTVTHAIGSGRRSAGLLLQAVLAEEEAAPGRPIQVFERPDRSKAVPITDIRLDHFARSPASKEASLPAEERIRTFEEVNRGLPDSMESHRCFSCGHCTECDTCLVYCPEGIVHRRGTGYEVDYAFCKGCGICVEECPRKAMEMVPTTCPSN